MSCWEISYSHSSMPKAFRGKTLKHANTDQAAIAFLGKHDKRQGVIIDKRGNVLSNVEIKPYEQARS